MERYVFLLALYKRAGAFKKHFNVQSSSAATFVLVPLTSVWEGLGLQCMCGNGISVYDPLLCTPAL